MDVPFLIGTFIYTQRPLMKDNQSFLMGSRIVGILTFTVKPVLSGHSKIDKTKVLKTDGS